MCQEGECDREESLFFPASLFYNVTRIAFLLRLGLKRRSVDSGVLSICKCLGHLECSHWMNGLGALGDKKKYRVGFLSRRSSRRDGEMEVPREKISNNTRGCTTSA